AATTVWGGKKVELNPTKWDWVKNTGYKKPAARHMQTVDGEMAGGNKPPKPSTQQHSTHSDNNIGLPAPYVKPDTSISPTGTIYVDSKGNAIPTPIGGYITGSPDARFIQVRDSNGNLTGARIDDAHHANTHQDPRALTGHAHVPGVTNDDGTPWLPIK
ncbi:polymorphic toxin MafB class 3, partial [Neisseria meningitidis]|nr:polymorphic toxin MafB class 3 [Neisseria meningitidis]MCL5813019.1 polymorphic toxin MafB class 3 [Neisseria meningitidis]MCL5849402.1 polymorphic toxin MafB class 3 [Neisseria meningitidis]